MTEKVQSASESGLEPAPMSGSVAGQEPAADTQSVVSQEPKAEGELPVDIIRKELSEARQEAARYRTEVRELQQKLEQGKVSEAELGKLQESLASLEAALSEREMRLQERRSMPSWRAIAPLMVSATWKPYRHWCAIPAITISWNSTTGCPRTRTTSSKLS